MSNDKTLIGRLLDTVEWRELNPHATWHERAQNELAEIPVATHEGSLEIMGFSLRVFQLSDGRRIIASEDLDKFVGGVTDAGDPQASDALMEADVAERFADFDAASADPDGVREVMALASILRDQERRLWKLENGRGT